MGRFLSGNEQRVFQILDCHLNDFGVVEFLADLTAAFELGIEHQRFYRQILDCGIAAEHCAADEIGQPRMSGNRHCPFGVETILEGFFKSATMQGATVEFVLESLNLMCHLLEFHLVQNFCVITHGVVPVLGLNSVPSGFMPIRT